MDLCCPSPLFFFFVVTVVVIAITPATVAPIISIISRIAHVRLYDGNRASVHVLEGGFQGGGRGSELDGLDFLVRLFDFRLVDKVLLYLVDCWSVRKEWQGNAIASCMVFFVFYLFASRDRRADCLGRRGNPGDVSLRLGRKHHRLQLVSFCLVPCQLLPVLSSVLNIKQ